MIQRRSIVRWLSACSVVPLLAIGVASIPAAPAAAAINTTYTVYNSGKSSIGGSEILDITPDNKYAMVVGTNDDRPTETSPRDTKLRAVTIAVGSGFVKQSFDIRAAFGGAEGLGMTAPVPSSVAMHPTDGYALVTLREDDPASGTTGKAVFIDIAANGTMSKRPGTSAVNLGVFPESVDIAPNGDYAVVTNEDPRTGPAGSIMIIDLREGSPTRYQVVQTINPTVPAGPTTRQQTDAEPETVAIAPNSARAFVTLQPNNAITVIDINPTTLAGTDTTDALPNVGTSTCLCPDGLAVTPDSQYVVTGDEGIPTSHASTVSLFQVGADRSLSLVDSVSIGAGLNAEMVAVGVVGGKLRAFAGIENGEEVAVLDIDPTGPDKLAFETMVDLDPENQFDPPLSPEGIAIANITSDLSYIVTANQIGKNISVIAAKTTGLPTLTPQAFLPIVRK